jgi:hypothetical protein
MKTSKVYGLASILALSLTLAFAVRSSSAPVPPPQQQIVACSSDDMKRHYCAADVSGGVQLVKKRSEADCVQGQTWGYDRRGIWVDRGCRADFQVGGAGYGGGDNVVNIYCASDNGRRNLCPADTRGGVQMVHKRSDAPCDSNVSWGYSDQGIWVDRGCRADFQIGSAGGDADRRRDRGDHDDHADHGDRRDRDDRRDDDHDRDSGDDAVQVITCSSDDMGRHDCPIRTHDRVRLVRQRSEAECVLDRTWGYDRRGIWVDRGCRADFEVGGNR